MALVSKLEDENRRLRDDVQNKNQLQSRSELLNSPESISKPRIIPIGYWRFLLGITREEVQCIKNLTDENLKLKRTIKSKEKELTQKNFDLEAVSHHRIDECFHAWSSLP